MFFESIKPDISVPFLLFLFGTQVEVFIAKSSRLTQSSKKLQQDPTAFSA